MSLWPAASAIPIPSSNISPYLFPHLTNPILLSTLNARSLCDSNPLYNGLLGVVATGNSAVYGGAMYIAASQELCGDPDNCFMVRSVWGKVWKRV